MFEEVIESYKLMALSDKREKLLYEIKVLIAVLEKMCEDKGIEFKTIKSNEILDLRDGNESEDDYLEATFVYIQYLKEVIGSLLIN